jgi:uncharacterized protein
VTNQQHPLRINVGFLLNQPAGTFREIHFDFPDVVLNPAFHILKLIGLVKLDRTPQGVLVEGNFQGESPSMCVRCLQEYQQKLSSHFTELFSFSHHPTVETGMVIPQNGNIDLEPIVRESLLVEMPIKSLCREDCQGLCPVCGENLNVTTCEHQRMKGS